MTHVTDSFDNSVIQLLGQGGVGVLPTDTIYGLSAAALNESAVNKVRSLKGRDSEKPFIILISDMKMLNLLSISKKEVEMAKKYWPGQLTIICDAANAPVWLHMGKYTLAIRQPDHDDLRKLINKTGPIISTSVNIQNDKPATNLKEAMNYFGDKLDFYVDAGELESLPSTVAKLVNGRLQVIRPGSIKIKNNQ